MHPNHLKQRLAAGRLVAGVMLPYAAPELVEMFGHAGFDFVLLDTEHGPLDAGSCIHLVRAAEGTGISTVVRVPETADGSIGRYLDIGVNGVMVPHIRHRADAEAIVRAVKYPPLGERSLSATRAVDYCVNMSLAEATVWSNEQTLIIAMIEGREALENLDEIVTVPGIDIFFIGPIDLSLALGVPPDPASPATRAAIEDVITRVKAAGGRLGLGGVRTPEKYRPFIERGVQLVTINARNLVLDPALAWRRGLDAKN